MKVLPIEKEPAPLQNRFPKGFWRVIEYGLLLGIVLVLVLGGVI